MARIVGLTVSLLLSIIALAEADVQGCTNRELTPSGTVQVYQSGALTTDEFKVVTNADSTLTFSRTESPSNRISHQENCAVILQDNKPAEVIMSFKLVGSAGVRYCWKAKLNNFVLFYVSGDAVPVSSGFTVNQCIAQLSDATSYQMMMKLPLPSPVPRPNFGVDMSAVMKPGVYRLSHSAGNGQQLCVGNTIQQSSLEIKSDSVTFKPCGTVATTYQTPFMKELYVAGFVTDDLLDVVRNPNQMNGGFAVLTYIDGISFTYYLMRVSTAAFADEAVETYLEMFALTTAVSAQSQTGYVDIKYILPVEIPDLITLRAYSDECLRSPCLNGGTCLDKWLNYTCLCPTGFGGINCLDREDECAKRDISGSLCSFRGSCVDTVDGYTCSCNDGYTGTICQGTTTCLSSTCKNGGTCYDPKIGNIAICDCATGWRGSTCEERYACASLKPCKNQGTCYDDPDTGSYICTCATGFFGKQCDGAGGAGNGTGPIICVPSLVEEICLNDGKCVDSKCECTGYYVGRYCENMNRWFIGSIVLIVLLAVIMIVTLIVCCFFCTRGRTLGTDGQVKEPYDPYDRSTYPAVSDQGFGVVGLNSGAGSTQGYGPTGFTVNQAAPARGSPLFLSNY